MSVLDLQCYIRSTGGAGFIRIPIGFEKLDIMAIRIQQVVNGFGWAYSRFNGIEQLGMVIAAHAYLYSLISDRLENVLRDGLERLLKSEGGDY